MKLTELKAGDLFCIEDTPTYPKLKIKGGYVDIRDAIVNRKGNCDHREVSILTCEDIAKAFDDMENLDRIKEWIADAKQYWNY